MKPLQISNQTTRRFVLGKQGLWPGRRWQGRNGLEQALKTVGAVQMDPLNVVARAHHIALRSRVLDYRTDDLDALCYDERKFFDYGGVLCIRPMDELPFWRVHMERRKDEPRWATFQRQNAALIRDVLAQIEARGPLGNRDFTGSTRVANYRGGKESTVALYYLCLTGELMVHHRKGFDRLYDLRDRVAPPEHNDVASTTEAEEHFSRQAIAYHGIISDRNWKNGYAAYMQVKIDLAEARRLLADLVDRDIATEVELEGVKGAHYILNEDEQELEVVAAGGVPDSWNPVGPTNDDEVVCLSPLDVVSSSGRSTRLFDFEYLWEVYKPAHKRRWGYYTLPILWGDDLVARIDMKLDREQNALHVLGFWLEDEPTGRDPAFIEALFSGLRRIGGFLEVGEIDVEAIEPPGLKRKLKRLLRRTDD